MIQRRNLLLSLLLLSSATIVVAAQQPPTKPSTAAKPSTTAPKQAAKQDPGERAFEANCNRCHYAPEAINPRITGTVVRHMRVRANLSAEDERLILKFFAP